MLGLVTLHLSTFELFFLFFLLPIYCIITIMLLFNFRDNLNKAYKRVKANNGASGVDGMSVEEALPWLKEHRNELLESIRNGKYKPSPVRRVEIPKNNGGILL